MAMMTPTSTNTNIISTRLKPLRPISSSVGRPLLQVSCPFVSRCAQISYVRTAGVKPPQNPALVQCFALVQPITLDLVKQRPETDAQPLGGFAAIAISGTKRVRNRLSLRCRDDVAQQLAVLIHRWGRSMPRPCRSGPKVRPVEHLLV